jgi:hypothetical protein
MAVPDAAIAELQSLERSVWPSFLAQHSGLPGPRANLTLVEKVATIADAPTIDELVRSGEEYSLMCAAAALGRRADDAEYQSRAHALASSRLWRVREGVAIGLQLLGDIAPARLTAVVLDWADDPDPLVQRAACAAICEPRLLHTPEAAATAIEVCTRATRQLAALPAERRARPDARTLRQALGYCWSVAIAADPDPGVAAFRDLDTADSDIAWIVNQNRRKKRLSVLLP